jgi:translation elongation factor EF-Ts
MRAISSVFLVYSTIRIYALRNDAAREVAMHLAAMNPQLVRKKMSRSRSLPSKKRFIWPRWAIRKSPPRYLKRSSWQDGKFMSEVCLEDQIFVKDPLGQTERG